MPRRFRMAHKLWLAVLLIVLLLLAVIGFSGWRAAALETRAQALERDLDARVHGALRWSGLVDLNVARTLAIVVSSDPAVQEQFQDVIGATNVEIGAVQKALEARALSDSDKAQMQRIAAERTTAVAARDLVRKLRSAGQQEQALAAVRQSYVPAVAVYQQTLRDFAAQQQRNAQAGREQVAAARAHMLRLAGGALGLLLLAMVVGAYYLIASIERPLAQARDLAGRIAGGDLSGQQNVARGDEFGDLLRSQYAMSQALARMVQRLRLGTDGIALASAEIAAGNQDLSARTEQSSSNLQQTAAAMEQFAGTIAQSAGSAQQASSLAAGATEVARRGGEVVTQVVATMQEINHSSKKIADIIGVIDSIAFQTNILALNAAVEAARAGEQGRGFAVVAAEVRNLAQRSAEAAKEIKQLIEASVEKVETGTRLVSDAGSTMTDIVQSVQRVTDTIGAISAAAAEQNSGVAQVNKAIGNLDQMTQENAALVEQSAAAAHSLREQADQLAHAVAMFKVGDAAHDAAPGSAQAVIAAARASRAPVPPATATPVPAPAAQRSAAKPLAASAARAPRLAGSPAPPAAARSAPPAPALSGNCASSKSAAARQGSSEQEEWESF